MNREEALAFLAGNHRGVFAVPRANGPPHLSPVVYALMEGKIRISTTWDRVKTRLLQQNPRASLCVITETFFGDYLSVEGAVRLVEDPDGRENLVLYRAITGGPPENVDEYLRAMRQERRLVLELSVDRMHPVRD